MFCRCKATDLLRHHIKGLCPLGGKLSEQHLCFCSRTCHSITQMRSSAPPSPPLQLEVWALFKCVHASSKQVQMHRQSHRGLRINLRWQEHPLMFLCGERLLVRWCLCLACGAINVASPVYPSCSWVQDCASSFSFQEGR